MEVTQSLVTREEAAAELGLKPATLAIWHSEGKHKDQLPCGRIGRRVYYRKADLDRFVANRIPAATASVK